MLSIETIVPDWDDLEEAIDTGAVKSKRDFRALVETMIGEPADRHYIAAVVAGMFPDSRERYAALPDNPSSLTAENVRDIRKRHSLGETLSALGRAFGVRHNTIADVVNFRTWRNVA